jgi:hypothetical protein
MKYINLAGQWLEANVLPFAAGFALGIFVILMRIM